MEWKITWRDGNTPYTVKNKSFSSEVLLLDEVKDLLNRQARDISISRVPAPQDLGGIPFADIVTGLQGRTVVPFLGAGVPLCGRPPGADWQYPDFSEFLPSGVELAAYIAHLANLPAWKLRDTENLARVASYYAITNPLSPLAKNLQRIFARGTPTKVHKFLSKPKLHPMVIVTTNYDTLMEQALEDAGVDFDTVVHCTDIEQQGTVLLRKHGTDAIFVEPKDVNVDPSKTTVLYKMHGSIDWQTNAVASPTVRRDNYVITEEDYVKFLSRLNAAAPVIPFKLLDHFRKTSFLFLGYSLEDWNVRVILDSLNRVMHDPSSQPVRAGLQPPAPQPGDPPPRQPNLLAQSLNVPPPGAASDNGNGPNPRTHWAIQLHPTYYDIEVWKGRRVVIRNSDLSDFVTGLCDPIYDLFSNT
jgi:SIR2-like domain